MKEEIWLLLNNNIKMNTCEKKHGKKKFYFFILFLFVMNIICYNRLKYYKNYYLDLDDLYKKSLYEISGAFLGKEYLSNDVINKKLLDEPPVFRTNNFDCVTFVEMVLAINISHNFDELYENLKKIKYKDSNIDFFSRNHFISVDWIVNNSWLLNNITTDITQGYKTKLVEIDKKSWVMNSHKELYNYLVENNQDYKIDEFDSIIQYVDYVPSEIIANNNVFLQNKIPKESIIFIVKDLSSLKKKIGTDLDVSHAGFVFKKEHFYYKYVKFLNIFDRYKIVFRHASSSKGKIVEVDFKKYIKNISKNTTKLQGIIILTLDK